ncbi:hypothetical protein LTR53_013309 [Teratosphaeriaceae sp. CCFEE 6253]|nr:hypothetical protein LTR53_013309 [Teratosphaeriaceae sp. CCFEE 6253]
MAEDGDGKHSGRSRFLSKSKWGKVLSLPKENDAPVPGAGGKVNSFKLNEDVVDFLKPSTEKSKPKIDIALAQRWPEAHEVRKASESGAVNTPAPQWSGYRRPRRRAGLMVGFVKTAPEIIGEGGDEFMEPVAEISRRKAAVGRSVSARVPTGLDDNKPLLAAQMSRPQSRQAQSPTRPEEEFRPSPVRRANTSHNEVSLPIQRKHISPPLPFEQPVLHRPSIGRTPTGFSTDSGKVQDPADYESDEEPPPPVPQIPHVLETEFPAKKKDLFDSPAPMTASTVNSAVGSTHTHPLSPVAQRKQRDMQANEGTALRRASTLYMKEENEDHPAFKRESEAGFLPSPKFYSALSNTSSSSLAPQSPAQAQGPISPDSLHTPGGPGPSPFADPRYIKRHSGEMAPAPTASMRQVSDTQRQGRPAQQPSCMQAQQPPRPDTQAMSNSQTQPGVAAGGRRGRTVEQPSYMRAAQLQPAAPYEPPLDQRRQTDDGDGPSYMRAIQPPSSDFNSTRTAPAPAPPQNMGVPQDTGRAASRSPMRDRTSDRQYAQAAPDKPRPFYSQPDHSSGSLNRFPPSPKFPGSRHSSHEETSPQIREPSSAGSLPSPRFYTPGLFPAVHSPRGSMLNPTDGSKPAASPYARGPSPADYFSAPRAPQPPRALAAQLRTDEVGRPSSSGSTRAALNATVSPPSSAQQDHNAELALSDFANRVAHMKGVFSLTAEKERPPQQCSPQTWLRAALWWYLTGKMELEIMLQQRGYAPAPQRELLTQAHVDLAKAWWIVSEQLGSYNTVESPQSARSPTSPAEQLPQSIALVRSHIKSLAASMQRSQLMPPHQSLIQGQDTRIWLEHPHFTTDAATVLSGAASRSILAGSASCGMMPLEALPIGDSRDVFCFGRFPVEVSVNTDEADTDRVSFRSVLTLLRDKRGFQPSIAIATQSELVGLHVGPRRGEERGLSWHDVSWKANAHVVVIHLPRGFDLTIRMAERDYRFLSNTVEHSRKIEHSLRPEADETLVHEARLAELQYADSSGTHAFPVEKLRSCMALVFERHAEHRDGSGVRKVHRGFRLLLATDPAHKSLSSVSHDLCRSSPSLFEFVTDASAGGTTAMVIRVRDESRQCRILLVFPDLASRQALYDIVNGLDVGADEAIVGKMAITGVAIQNAFLLESVSPAIDSALHSLQWQKLGVTNYRSDDPNSRLADTVESESLRIVARHAAGCITDRLNLGKGELLFRLPCAGTPTPAIQLLREPQHDLGMSVDTRQCPPNVTDGICELYRLAQQHATIRTFTFATAPDLHAFQASITGCTVTYDGVASAFDISHRMNFVPIYQKKKASNVRLQIVRNASGSVTQVLAFMEEFALADAMCFQVKSTDTFEGVKGDGKNKKWAVKFVDAKFRLPARVEKGEVDGEERVRRRFVNLEGLEYAEEHDDVTVGFDTEEARDRFAQALPAETKVGRGLTLKRRI